MQANPCSLSRQIAVVQQENWRHERIQLGCVPRFQAAPPPMAPSDLRRMQLPASWNTMVRFMLSSGNTEYIPNLPASLRELEITKNRLQELPPLPNFLRTLELDNNELSELPQLPSTCIRLNARRNRLVNLPSPLPEDLRTIHVTHNYITELPSFIGTIVESVGLGFNRLTSLPSFPMTIRNLGCPNNEITSISNLPPRLEVLNCSNNPLTSLKIDNLRVLRLLVATNCQLKRIPILPLGPNVEENNNDDDNDGGNNNSGENGPNVILHNNPLEPNFARIYQQYQEDGDYGHLRRRVLREHRRIIAEQKATLGTMIQTFKPAVLEERPSEDAADRRLAEMRQRVFANHGPGNLIASFITGKPGTIEAQRLALVGNQERLGAFPPGTEAEMRKRIANVAVFNAENKNNLVMKERAKLYVRESNVQEAKKRYEKFMAEQLARKIMREKREELVTPLVKLQGLISDQIIKADKDLDAYYFNEIREKHKHLLKRIPQLEQECREVIETLYLLGDCTPLFEKLVSNTLKNRVLRKYAHLRFILEFLRTLKQRVDDIYTVVISQGANLDTIAGRYKNLLKDPESIVSEYVDLLHRISEMAFPENRSEEEIEAIRNTLKELCTEIVREVKAFQDKIEVENENAFANKYEFENENVSEKEAELLKELGKIHNDFVKVVNDDEDEGEAIRYAIAEEEEEDDDEYARLEALRNEELEEKESNNENNAKKQGGRRRTPRQRRQKAKRLTRKH